MKIEQTANELVLKESRAYLWFWALILMLAGSWFIYSASGGSIKEWTKLPFWEIALILSGGGIFVGIGFWGVLNSPRTTITLNRRTKKIIYSKRRLAGNVERHFGFDQVRKFRTIEENYSDNPTVWFLAMECETGEIVKMSAVPNYSPDKKESTAYEMNSFIRTQIR
jgi:hypothetical protein